jgi:hypothetical protein
MLRADGGPDVERRSISPPPAAPGPAGALRTVGAYPFNLKGYTVTPLAEGGVFVYGAEPLDTRGDGEVLRSKLRNRAAHALSGAYFNEPLLWNPQRHGWERLPLPPECRYYRVLHTATALPNGRILIAGGLCDAPRMADDHSPLSAYDKLSLWDSTTRKWEAAPSLAVGRLHHSASVMADGSVMLVGGMRDPAVHTAAASVLDSVERYSDGRVAALPPLHVARARHTATPLADGGLLVVGGLDQDDKPSAAVERWDPAIHAWRQAPPLARPRYNHTATRLQDGRVLVAGGISQDGEPIGSTEIWDPVQQQWSSGAPLLLPLQGHAAALLNNGDVLVIGGATVHAAPVSFAMLWDRSREEWRPAGFLQSDGLDDKQVFPYALVPRADGSVHVFGDRWIAQWQPAGEASATVPLYAARENHTTTLLHDGRVLLAGGRVGHAFVDWAEIYDPASGRFTATARMPHARHSHSALVLDDGRVVVAGGWIRTPDEPNQALAHAPEVWDPASGRWSGIPGMRFEWQDNVRQGKLADGRVLFFAVREFAEDLSAPQGPMEYRAWTWNPGSGRVERLSPSGVPHSKAVVVVLPDGRVLRVGGDTRHRIAEYRCPPTLSTKRAHAPDGDGNGCQDRPAHWEEQADPSAEVWDSRTGQVTALAAPPAARTEHLRALLLRNGDVLLVTDEPLNVWGGLRPSPVILWNARTGQWRALPPLPADSRWPVTERKDGTLVSNTRWLTPGAPAWTPAPAYPQYAWPNASNITSAILPLASGQLLALSTARPYAAVLDEKSTDWKVLANHYLLRESGRRPALLALADGRLLVSGMAQGRTGLHPTVQIWDPKDDTWTVTTTPAGVYNGAIQVVQLPSGRVLHLGMDSKNNLVCETWQPRDDTWSVCGYIQSKEQPISEFYLGALGDGRVALMLGNLQLHVYDEPANTWRPMNLQWSTSPMTFGAPIRVGGPLVRAFDPSKRTWIDASVLGSRYTADHTNSHKSLSLLWDPAKQEFTYFFAPASDGMGRDAVVLPDGCALSAFPLSIFNPTTAKVTSLALPVTGIPASASALALLPGGVVVIAGYPNGAVGVGAGFFQRKATCAGFETLPGDDAFVPGVLAGPAAGAPRTAPAAAPAAPVSRWTALGDRVQEYRLAAQVALGVLLVYVSLRYALLPLIQRSRLIDPGRQVPRPVTRILRIAGYSVAAIIIVPMLLSYLQFRQAVSEDDCAGNAAACLDQDTGLLKSIPSLAGHWLTGRAPPIIPCRYVGVWSSRQPNAPMYRITLNDDGRYTAEQSRDGREVQVMDTGYWMVQNDHMVWRSERRSTGEADINAILPESDTRFQLVEGNGSRTQYELIRATASGRCTR